MAWVTNVYRISCGRFAHVAVLIAALALPSCAKRFGGAWPFGEDQTALLKKYGPVPVQRIETMQDRAQKLAKASAVEQEAFAAELARQMPNETDVNVRLAIIDVLGHLDTPSAHAVLYAGLKDPEIDVRVTCCEAWAHQPSAESTRMLAETLSGDTDLDVRMAAAKGLASANDKDAVKALGLALEDSDPAIQLVAMNSMRQVTGKDLGNDVNAWRTLAKQPDPPVHDKAIASRFWKIF